MTPISGGSEPEHRTAFSVERTAHDARWWAVCDIPHQDGWLVIMRFDTTSGVSQLRELRIVPEAEDTPVGRTTTAALGFTGTAPAGGEITTRLLRTVPTRELRDLAEAHARQLVPTVADRAMPPPRRPGRPGQPDEYYARWAYRYTEMLVGASRTPVKDMAENEHLSPSQVRGILHEARRRGLLTATPQGRAGGELTNKARGLLGVGGN